MADFNITVANSLRVYGSKPTEKWGDLTWGSDHWGYDSGGLPLTVQKLISGGISLTPAVARHAGYYLSYADTLTLTGAVELHAAKYISFSNAITVDADMSEEAILDGSGYYRLFPGDAANAENRVSDGFSRVSGGSATWATATSGSATWSKL